MPPTTPIDPNNPVVKLCAAGAGTLAEIAGRVARWVLVGLFVSGLAACKAPPSSTPKPALPAERDPGFTLRFEYGICYYYVLDTGAGALQRRVPGENLLEVPLALTSAELDTIYQGLLAIDFMSYPERYVTPTSAAETIAKVQPAYQYRLTVQSGSVTHTVAWIDDTLKPNPPEAAALRTFFRQMIGMVEARAEFQALPAARVGCV